MAKEQVTQNDWQKEIARAVKTVYGLTPEFKVDGGKSVKKILKGESGYSMQGLAIGAMALGFKEMGLSQEEATQILSQLPDKPILPDTLK